MSLTREEVCLIDTGIIYLADYIHKNRTDERTLSDDGTLTLRFIDLKIPQKVFDEIYQTCKENPIYKESINKDDSQ